MPAIAAASWFLEQEARAQLTRLDRVKPFVLQETMVPAAGPMPAATFAIERYLLEGRRRLRDHVVEYIRWLRGPGRAFPPHVKQRRFTILRLWFNSALSQLDLFAEALSQRSEHETGVWLAGLDVAAQDALALPEGYYEAPPVVCYLHRGLGGAIRRARTRLPGGGENPVAIIRIPRERMIGHGIASSLAHEVGHQAAALLNLVESVRPAIQRAKRRAAPDERIAWGYLDRCASEICADLWALGRVGITSTLGLMGIVSLPRWFVFRVALDDPHPFPWIRVKLSCRIGNALYPHPQWAELFEAWQTFYPLTGLDPERRRIVGTLQRILPGFVSVLLDHRPVSLRGSSIREVLTMPDRTPDKLLALYERWRVQPKDMHEAAPTLVLAVFGRARAKGRLTPEEEDRLLGKLITDWAFRSTLAFAGASPSQPPQRLLLATDPFQARGAVPPGPIPAQGSAQALPASPPALTATRGG